MAIEPSMGLPNLGRKINPFLSSSEMSDSHGLSDQNDLFLLFFSWLSDFDPIRLESLSISFSMTFWDKKSMIQSVNIFSLWFLGTSTSSFSTGSAWRCWTRSNWAGAWVGLMWTLVVALPLGLMTPWCWSEMEGFISWSKWFACEICEKTWGCKCE